MKKKLLLTTISIIFALQTVFIGTISYAAKPEISVVLDGKTLDFDVPSQIINDRTMVPVRKIFEELGMEVSWDDETKTVSAYKPGVYIELPVDSYTAYRNTVELNIDAPAMVIEGRTLVPVRVVSEYAGATVKWDSKTSTVYITSTDNIQYLGWNDNYIYCGEVENGKANGYGILYTKSDDSVSQLGKYIDSKIVVGTDYFDNGEAYIGNYENGSFAYGTYYYEGGDIYTGEFQNGKKHGEGKYTWLNGSYYEGNWADDSQNGHGIRYYANGDYIECQWSDGVPHGKGTHYLAIENVYMSGNYTNGKRNGTFTLYDPVNNITLSREFVNDELKDDINSSSSSKENTERYEKIQELEKQYAELKEWYATEMEALYDYITNGDPFDTDWAKSIKSSFYASYGVSSGSSYYSGGVASNGGNIDSYSAANAMRQNAALKAQADAAIQKAVMEYNQTYIENWKESIQSTYNTQKAYLDSMAETLSMGY